MCYNSPVVQREISRIVSKIVGPALKGEIARLKQENKEFYLPGFPSDRNPELTIIPMNFSSVLLELIQCQ
jgi:hypothetical protein